MRSHLVMKVHWKQALRQPALGLESGRAVVAAVVAVVAVAVAEQCR